MSTKKRPQDLTIPEVERAIGIKTRDWHGACYQIACAILRAGLVSGRPAYGHYLGPVASTGYWASRRGQGFQRHGWIVVDDLDETIVDPTRFSFEDKRPYLHFHACAEHEFVCADCGLVPEEHGVIEDSCLDFRQKKCDYDEGGNRIREEMEQPPPKFSASAKTSNTVFPADARKYVMDLLGHPKAITRDMLFWIANLSLRRLGPYAADIYRAYLDAGDAGMLPVDNRIVVLGEKSLK